MEVKLLRRDILSEIYYIEYIDDDGNKYNVQVTSSVCGDKITIRNEKGNIIKNKDIEDDIKKFMDFYRGNLVDYMVSVIDKFIVNNIERIHETIHITQMDYDETGKIIALNFPMKKKLASILSDILGLKEVNDESENKIGF